MGHEVSLFINSASFVGREVARRIVLQSAGFSREDSDEENPDDACVLCFMFSSPPLLLRSVLLLGGDDVCPVVFSSSLFIGVEFSAGMQSNDEDHAGGFRISRLFSQLQESQKCAGPISQTFQLMQQSSAEEPW